MVGDGPERVVGVVEDRVLVQGVGHRERRGVPGGLFGGVGECEPGCEDLPARLHDAVQLAEVEVDVLGVEVSEDAEQDGVVDARPARGEAGIGWLDLALGVVATVDDVEVTELQIRVLALEGPARPADLSGHHIEAQVASPKLSGLQQPDGQAADTAPNIEHQPFGIQSAPPDDGDEASGGLQEFLVGISHEPEFLRR